MKVNSTQREHAVSRIRVEAPVGMDPLTIAQAIVGADVLLKAEVNPKPRNPFDRRLAMSQLYEKVTDAYAKGLDRLVADIRDYIDKEVIGLKKAKAPKALVSPDHLDEIAQMVIDHHAKFIVEFGGANTKAEVARLVKEKKLSQKAMDAVFDSYTYGLLTGRIAELDTAKRGKKLSYENFTRRKKRKPIPLSEVQQNALAWMKKNFSMYVKNHGRKIAHELISVMGSVKNDFPEWRRVASEIGHRTGAWTTDLKRIAATELHHAMQEGYKAGLIEREGDPRSILVVKLPNPDACKVCVKLHLTNGRGSPPRVFTLADLEKNATNVGRKQPDWKAVVGAVHPWCACELQHVPPGWGYERTPPDGQGWVQVPRKKGAYRKQISDGRWIYWSPRLVPDTLRRGIALKRDLLKSTMTYGDSVPEKGCSIRVGDPLMRQAIEEVLAQTPEELFDKKVGVTLITTDIPRPGVALNEHDLAYWTGNEIRLSQTLPYDKVRKVMQHELGHVLNVHLIHKWGGEAPVIEWHNKLYEVAKEEGFISRYASTLPIECAAEATRLYLFDRTRLMLNYPRQFSILHAAYRDVFEPKKPDPMADLPQGLKKGGPYIGPRGGKWADPKHTIPWKEKAQGKKAQRKEAESQSSYWEKVPIDDPWAVEEFLTTGGDAFASRLKRHLREATSRAENGKATDADRELFSHAIARAWTWDEGSEPDPWLDPFKLRLVRDRQEVGKVFSKIIFDGMRGDDIEPNRVTQRMAHVFGPLWHHAVLETYNHTQKKLAKAGISDEIIYRGTGGRRADLPADGKPATVGVWGVSSWTTKPKVARTFARSPGGGLTFDPTNYPPQSRVLAGRIRAKNIFLHHKVNSAVKSFEEDEVTAIFDTPNIEVACFKPGEDVETFADRFVGKAGRVALHIDEAHGDWLIQLRKNRGSGS